MSLLTGASSLITNIRGAAQAIRASRRGQQAVAVARRVGPAVGVAGGAAGLGYLAGTSGEPQRRRRSRGITARDFRTTQRTLRKISKMYAKLPRRASHRAPMRGYAGKRTEIVNVD